jgi:hypothetical protein
LQTRAESNFAGCIRENRREIENLLEPLIFEGLVWFHLTAQHLQRSSILMSTAIISSPESGSLFQVAANLEIPGLPVFTHPALAALRNRQKRRARARARRSSKANVVSAIESARNHFMNKVNDFDVWLAAISAQAPEIKQTFI